MINRINELDVFRGLAALSVVLFHFLDNYDRMYGHTGYYPSFTLGFFRMHLFFILSGFVTLLLLDRIKSPMDFVVSRISRLYPVFLTVMVVTGVIYLAIPDFFDDKVIRPRQYVVNLTIFGPLFTRTGLIDRAHWTLCLEVFYYFIMLCVFSCGLHKRIESVGIVWLGILTIFSIMYSTFDMRPAHPYHFRFIQYSAMLVSGMIMYRMRTDGATTLHFLMVCWALALVLSFFNMQTMFVVAGLHYIFHMSNKQQLNFLNVAPLRFLGTISYSLYVVHLNIGYGFINLGYSCGFNTLTAVSAAFCIVVVLSIFLTFYVEQPALKLTRTLYNKAKAGYISSRQV